MLTLTDQAATEIRTLSDQPGMADTGGMRIAHEAGALTLSLANQPAEEDVVLDVSGARLFLDPEAALLLNDKTLHATSDPDGQVQFGIFEQDAPT